MIEVNIRGKKNPYTKKVPFDDIDDIKTLHDCFDCEGCLLEEFCKEQEEKDFGKDGD